MRFSELLVNSAPRQRRNSLPPKADLEIYLIHLMQATRHALSQVDPSFLDLPEGDQLELAKLYIKYWEDKLGEDGLRQGLEELFPELPSAAVDELVKAAKNLKHLPPEPRPEEIATELLPPGRRRATVIVIS